MGERVQLVGLDFGTTTSSAVVASAQLTRNSVTGRMDMNQVREEYRSDLVFTPFSGDLLDEAAVAHYLDAWLAAGQVVPDNVFGGGALLTGLTAQKENAAALVGLIRRRLEQALIATADDPVLESWLAFHGSCGTLSRAHPAVSLLNFDVGGGTTNLALGRGGEVRRAGCLFVGARHIQVEPGTYRMTRISQYAAAILAHLGISKSCGDTLAESELDAVLGFYVDLLEAAVMGRAPADENAVRRLHVRTPFCLPKDPGEMALVFSGGVGELIYAHVQGKGWPATTCFGDLGIDLAERIVRSPLLSRNLRQYVPAAAGRATVYGLLRHSTEISGSTLFLPEPAILPLADLPIFGPVLDRAADDDVCETLRLVRNSAQGGGVRLALSDCDAAAVASFGKRLGRLLQETGVPVERPLVLFIQENVGKTLGNYVTGWGASSRKLVVIDEVEVPDAQYARIGVPRQQVVPVSFYGLSST